MRAILKALKAALAAVFSMIDGVWTTLFGAGGGGGVQYIEDDLDHVPDEQPEQAEPPVKSSLTSLYEMQTIASCIVSYAADAQVDLVRPAFAPALRRSVKEWLPGLSYSELERLTDAGPIAIAQHIATGPYIDGVPKVWPLPPVTLQRPPARDFSGELTAWKLAGTFDSPEYEAASFRAA